MSDSRERELLEHVRSALVGPIHVLSHKERCRSVEIELSNLLSKVSDFLENRRDLQFYCRGCDSHFHILQVTDSEARLLLDPDGTRRVTCPVCRNSDPALIAEEMDGKEDR